MNFPRFMMSTMEELEGPSKIVFCITVRGYHLHKRVSVLVSVWGGEGCYCTQREGIGLLE